jgi:hypothetical protein
MFGQLELGREFFEGLVAIDEAIVAEAAKGRCPRCGGPLHRGDFRRKPRFGLIAPPGVDFDRRFSLCCGREGCRQRATPPSVRFLGRRVYAGAVVIVASVVALAAATARASAAATGVAARTTRRWLSWWRGPFARTGVFVAIRARLPATDRLRLPASILEQLPGGLDERVTRLLRWLMPITIAAGAAARLPRNFA